MWPPPPSSDETVQQLPAPLQAWPPPSLDPAVLDPFWPPPRRRRAWPAVVAVALAVALLLGSIPLNNVVLDPDLPSGPEAYVHYGGTPLVWRSCSVTWSAPSSGPEAPSGDVLADITEAFSRLGALTGYQFSRVAADGEITVAVGDPPEPGTHDATGTLDTAGSTTVTSLGRYITAAAVVLDPETLEASPSGFATMDANGTLVLHELAHAVGLDHVNHEGSLMHPVQVDAPFTLSPGDLAGLAAAGGDCHPG